MFKKLTIENIGLDNEVKKVIVTKPIYGEVEKIIVKYKKNSSENLILKIFSSDGELLVSVEGNEDTIFYPRNWNVMNQRYEGISIAPEGSNVLYAEKYVLFGSLVVFVQGASIYDGIDRIDFIIRGEIGDTITLSKQDAEIITKQEIVKQACNSGIEHNHVYKRRIRKIQELIQKTFKNIAKSEGKHDLVYKTNYKELANFIEESLYEGKFDGLSKSLSDLIKEYIVRAMIKGYPIQRIITYIDRKGKDKINRARAEIIARTETQALQNKIREWSYKKIDPEGKFKYKWIGPDDNRTTEVCKRIKERTRAGVTLEQLKKIIHEEAKNAGFEPREFTPHINCRHTFVRVY